MERGKGSKVIAIVALCVAVAGLSLGFAAFSSTLNIKSSADVKPDKGDFKVVFDKITNTSMGLEGATAGNPSITESEVTNSAGETVTASTLEGVTATFTAPGQKVSYSYNAKNTGKYIAYLNSVTFANASGQDKFKSCTAGTGTDATKVAAACEDIKITITVGSDTFTTTDKNVSNHTLAIENMERVIVDIEYVDNTATGGINTLADGDFSVAFGDIQLEYGSVD